MANIRRIQVHHDVFEMDQAKRLNYADVVHGEADANTQVVVYEVAVETDEVVETVRRGLVWSTGKQVVLRLQLAVQTVGTDSGLDLPAIAAQVVTNAVYARYHLRVIGASDAATGLLPLPSQQDVFDGEAFRVVAEAIPKVLAQIADDLGDGATEVPTTSRIVRDAFDPADELRQARAIHFAMKQLIALTSLDLAIERAASRELDETVVRGAYATVWPEATDRPAAPPPPRAVNAARRWMRSTR